jgi:glutaminase
MLADIQHTIDSLHHRLRGLATGSVATYIPELAKVDPDQFSIAITTIDGQQYHVGDSHVEFTLQSLSKPFVFGHALTVAGRDTVVDTTGVEPTGNAFDSMVRLDRVGKPVNPMVNAGAIVTASLIPGATLEERFEIIRELLGVYLASPPMLDTAVYESECRTGDRNRALGYLLKSRGTITGDVDEHIDLYFRQCSLKSTVSGLANAAATLANQGVNPVSGMRALDTTYVKDVLVVMLMSGMYDYAGRWAYEIGLPAKSGVSGGILAVVPGLMGIAVHSPRLDDYGNSTRGLAVFRELAERFNLHILNPEAAPSQG